MENKGIMRLQTIQKNKWLNYVLRYSASVLVVFIAFLLYSLMTVWFGLGLPTYILFYPAVIIVAILLGLGPGLLATALSVIMAVTWILPPIGIFSVPNTIDEIGVGLFATMGVLISSVAELYRRNRKKAIAYDKEMALRESEGKYKAVIETAQEGIVITEPEGPYYFVNQKMVDMLGYPIEEILGKSSIDFMCAEDQRAQVMQAREELSKNGLSGEFKFCSKDGSVLWTSYNASPLYDSEGNHIGNLALHTDITKRKKAEEELRQARNHLEKQVEERTSELEEAYQTLKESEVKYRELFNNINDMITLSEIKANGMPGKYIEVNEVGVKRMGYSKEEFLNLSPVDIVAPEYRAEMPKNAVVMAEKGSSNFEIVQITKDGKRIPIEVNGHIINYKGRKTYLTVSRDITERKKAEEKLKETIQELERSNKELQSFAYITSHDLQEPLRTMGNYAGLLKHRYQGQLDEDADDFLDFMASGAARMKDMVQGLLDYSRVGTQGEEFREFSSEEAFNKALINLQSSIEECHAEVTHEPLPEIVADESQITRVFQNLIGNAIKFRKEGVQPKIHVSTQKEDEEYIFSVSDNGIGLEEQYTDRIFEVFKRLHAIGEYEGAGIGLAIVKRVIDRHHGRIWVESELGVGSTFYFTIPIEPVQMGGGQFLKSNKHY